MNPGVQQPAAVQADRVPVAGFGREPVLSVRGRADGDARRHQGQGPPRRAAGQGHL